MKTVLLFACAALALTAVPALADNGQIDDWSQYRISPQPPQPRQCFSGKAVTGANRSGEKTLYVQAGRGAIFRLQLADGCAALDAAETLTVRAEGGDVVCARSRADVVAHTPAGARRCRVAEVRPLTSREVAVLAKAVRR